MRLGRAVVTSPAQLHWPCRGAQVGLHRCPILRTGGGEYSICGWKGAVLPLQEAPIADH